MRVCCELLLAVVAMMVVSILFARNTVLFLFFSAGDSSAVHCARAEQLLHEHKQQRRGGVQHVGALSGLLQRGSAVNCHRAP